MNVIAAGLTVGSRVVTGQLIGRVGNSGDARYGGSHLHFEPPERRRSDHPFKELIAVDPQSPRH